ncbi:hypothetical protein [Dactylosporangium sp. NPDC000521]|uniref:hypothetical protein n=1 Tax=Dactylosporangium sp. NPDC000521 TaxID=3363975 RepID=UPI003691DED5
METSTEASTELVDRAGALLAGYDFAGAYEVLVEVRSRVEHGVEVGHTDAIDAARMLADTMLALGQTDAATTVVADLTARSDLGPFQAAMLALTQARLLTAQSRLDEAAACYQAILRQQLRGTGRWPFLLAIAGDAALTAARGRPATAEPALTHAYTQLVDEYGTGHADVIRIGVELTRLRTHIGSASTARDLGTRLAPAAITALGPHHPLVTQLHHLLDQLDLVDQPPPAVAAVTRTQQRPPDSRPHTPSFTTPTSPASPAPQQPPLVRRGPHVRGGRVLPYWALVTAVACGAALATAVTAVAIGALLPGREPVAGRHPTTVPGPTRTPWQPRSPVVLPAQDVRIVRDTGTTIDVAWTDPSGGTRPTVLYLAKDTAPATVAATVQAAATRFRLTGLDPRARRYCIGVAVVYSPTSIARAPDVCTSRPTSTPASTQRPQRGSTPNPG